MDFKNNLQLDITTSIIPIQCNCNTFFNTIMSETLNYLFNDSIRR